MQSAVRNIWFQETLHMHDEERFLSDDSFDAMETAPSGSEGIEKRPSNVRGKQSSGESLIRNWPLMSSIIVYCIFSLHDMAYTEVLLILNFDFNVQ